jgi:hypothetical protein
MRLPQQNAPVIRPTLFPLITQKSPKGELVEFQLSNVEPNDPAPFSGPSEVSEIGCHILADPARCFAGRSWF